MSHTYLEDTLPTFVSRGTLSVSLPPLAPFTLLSAFPPFSFPGPPALLLALRRSDILAPAEFAFTPLAPPPFPAFPPETEGVGEGNGGGRAFVPEPLERLLWPGGGCLPVYVRWPEPVAPD